MFKTAEETHFQCPECGQRGAVPTEILEKAMQENEHVQISCTSCQAKFQPFNNLADMAKANEADIGALADEDSAENLTGSIAEAVADLAESVEAGAANETQATQGDNDNEEIDVADLPDNPNSLPDWLKPPDKPAQTPEDDAQAAQPIEAETLEAEDTLDSEEKQETEPGDDIEQTEEASEEVWERLDDLNDPDISDFSQTGTTDSTAGSTGDSQPLNLAQTALISPMPVAAPQPTRRFSFFSFVKMLVFLALIAATAGNSYLLLQQNPELQALIPVQMTEPAKITVREAGFEKLSAETGAPIMVKAVFVNRGQQDGILADFDVLLRDAGGTTLMRWRVEGHGQTIAAGQQHSISSTLFSPPANVASVALAYPAR